MGRIDANTGYVGMAATDDSNLTPSSLLVDPTTGRLLIVITPTTEPATLSRIRIDVNDESTATAVTDDADATIRTLLTDENGLLLCDINVE